MQVTTNNSKTIKYIAENASFLGDDNYDFDPLVFKINEKRLEKKYDVSITVGHFGEAYVYSTSAKFSVKGTDFEKIEKDFLKACEKYGSLEKTKLFSQLDSTFFYYFFSYKGGNEFYMSKENGNMYVFYFLDYILKGELPEDFVEINDFLSRNKVHYNADSFDLKEVPEYNNISIKKYKNGKIIITGLTDKNLKKIKEVQDFMNAHRR